MYVLIGCLSLTHLNGYAGSVTCDAGDTVCIANATSNNEGNAALLVLLAVVVVGGIYMMSKKADKPTTEEATFRAKEIANGYGIRLNSIHSPIRVSLFPSRQDRFTNHMQSNYSINESNSNYLSVGINF